MSILTEDDKCPFSQRTINASNDLSNECVVDALGDNGETHKMVAINKVLCALKHLTSSPVSLYWRNRWG